MDIEKLHLLYTVLSTVMILFLLVIWRKDNWVNLLIKFILASLTILGVVVIYGLVS
jgi:hypothetical protein